MNYKRFNKEANIMSTVGLKHNNSGKCPSLSLGYSALFSVDSTVIMVQARLPQSNKEQGDARG